MKTENKIIGKIKSILPIEKGTSKNGKEWKKQSIVIDNLKRQILKIKYLYL